MILKKAKFYGVRLPPLGGIYPRGFDIFLNADPKEQGSGAFITKAVFCTEHANFGIFGAATKNDGSAIPLPAEPAYHAGTV